jgi:DeoR family deoxyribose operon repressor
MSNRNIRIQLLARELLANPSRNIRDLSSQFQVSEMTIRRDLQYIEDNHLISQNEAPAKTAVKAPTAHAQSTYVFSEAQASHTDAKNRIGAYAASLISPNDVLILDTGTTVNALAENLPEDFPYTVICYNSNILPYIRSRSNISLILAGGYYHPGSMSFESTENIELLSRLRATKIFVSTSGVEKTGLTCSNQYEVITKQTAINSAMKKILLCDSSKFGIIRSSFFARLTDMDTVISDTDLSDDWVDYMREANLRVDLV